MRYVIKVYSVDNHNKEYASFECSIYPEKAKALRDRFELAYTVKEGFMVRIYREHYQLTEEH